MFVQVQLDAGIALTVEMRNHLINPRSLAQSAGILLQLTLVDATPDVGVNNAVGTASHQTDSGEQGEKAHGGIVAAHPQRPARAYCRIRRVIASQMRLILKIIHARSVFFIHRLNPRALDRFSDNLAAECFYFKVPDVSGAGNDFDRKTLFP